MAATNGGTSMESPATTSRAELARRHGAIADTNTGRAARRPRAMTDEPRFVWARLTRAARTLAARAYWLAGSLGRALAVQRRTDASLAGTADTNNACTVNSAAAAPQEPPGLSAPTVSEWPLLPEVECVNVLSDFGEQLYPALFERLQLGPRCKVLDLRAARVLRVDLFERLAGAWHASPVTIPKLAIVLGYESWAVLHKVARRRLQPLVDRGVAVELFYAQQIDRLPIWLARDRIDHDVAAVVTWLRTEWRGTATASPPPADSPKVQADKVVAVWPAVLRATAKLAEKYAPVEEVPGLLLEVAALARSFGDPDGTAEEIKHLHATLYWLGDAPSSAKCRGLRALALAHVRRGDAASALQLLESATTIATVIGDRIEAASALAEIGHHALQTRHFTRAERWLRRAIALTTDRDPPDLRAALHHHLARALHEQGKDGDEAAHRARAALAQHRDPGSQLASADQALLAAIEPGDRPARQPIHPSMSRDTGQQVRHDKPV